LVTPISRSIQIQPQTYKEGKKGEKEMHKKRSCQVEEVIDIGPKIGVQSISAKSH